MDIGIFLADSWQRKPLLIKNAIPGFMPPVSSDELAGLALEEEIESRIIEQRGNSWRLQHGPFAASDFVRKNPWTLLVQAVDHYVPAVAELFQLIDFIPRWRMDDIMVSYAVDGGSVGPHFDSYDVFLLQGEGQRLWRLGQRCDRDTRLLPHNELRILHRFDTREEYLLGPGDALYVPPGIAHWGIAQGECTTFSIGMRAPRTSEMLSRWSEQLLQQIDPQLFFSDAGRNIATRPGELVRIDIDHALAQLHDLLARPTDHRWFGELVTEPRYDIELLPRELARARALLRQGPQSLELSPAAKLAWQQDTGGVLVYTNGESVSCTDDVLPSLLRLCEDRCLHGKHLDTALANADTFELLDKLLQSGCIDVQ
jgi:50S ribosomal protein L16 3-hydroxylase